MELQIFNSTEFGSVRTATVNGEVMFVGKDVADKKSIYFYSSNLLFLIYEAVYMHSL